MPNNFFITGLPKSGKTTLLKKLVDDLKLRKLAVGGFLSPDEKVHGTRTGFRVMDICTGKKARLAAIDIDGPRVSKYHVDLRSFESFLSGCMKEFERFDVLVVDEIGRMEMKSTLFQDSLEEVLESHIPLIASLHRDYIEDYKVWGTVIDLTRTNAGRVYLELLQNTQELRPGKKAAKKKAAKEEKKPKKAKKKPAKKKKAARKGLRKAPPAEPEPLEPEPFTRPPLPGMKKGPAKARSRGAKKAKKKKAGKQKAKKKEGGIFGWIREKISS